MILKQSWVGYLDRSYEQIKRSLLNRLGNVAPEINDYSETNPLIIIISMFSGVAEVLHLYLDTLAREAFLGTARKYSSVVKLVKLINYTPKARNYATADLLFTLIDTGTNSPIVAPGNITIPVGTEVFPLNSDISFKSLQAITLPAGRASVYIPFGQFTQVLSEPIGNTSPASAPLQQFPLSDKYVHGSLKVRVDGEDWPLYNFLGLMGATTKGVIVEIDENADAYFKFGDGVNGAIPGASLPIVIDYWESEGELGNLPPNSITEIQSVLSTPANTRFICNNPGYSVGGTSFEDIDKIRDLAPRSIRSLDRAVTYQDYIDVCLQVPGVGDAEVKYCCGKYVDVYIAPISSGIATLAMINRVKNYLDCRSLITVKNSVKPSGLSRIWIKARVLGKPLLLSADILRQVINGLDDILGQGVVKINRRVSITDIISYMEGLSTVDTFEISELRIEPYARPQENTTNILTIQYPILPHTTIRAFYDLVYKSGPNHFEVYKNGIFLTLLAPGATYNDGGTIAFKPMAGAYLNNDKWQFVVLPSYPEIFPNTLVVVDDYSAPVVDISPFVDNSSPRDLFSELEIVEQGSSASCLPNC